MKVFFETIIKAPDLDSEEIETQFEAERRAAEHARELQLQVPRSWKVIVRVVRYGIIIVMLAA